MGSRWPPLENIIPVFYDNLVGAQVLVAPQSGIALNLKSLIVSGNGVAGQALFSSNGVSFTSVSVAASGTSEIVPNITLAIGSGISVDTTASLDISAFYVIVDQTQGVSKEQGRANTYNAYLAQKTAGQQATRTPNRFGGQTEG